jgi:hypothetical protein
MKKIGKTVRLACHTDDARLPAVVITESAGVDGGTFKIRVTTLAGVAATTPNLAWNVAAADMETALVALATVGVGGVTVAGAAGGPYTLTWGVTVGYVTVSLVDDIMEDGGVLEPGTVAPASTTLSKVALYDADGNVVTLASGERLILDMLSAEYTSAVITDEAHIFVDVDGDGVIDAGDWALDVLSRFVAGGVSRGWAEWSSGDTEGAPLPIGLGLTVRATAAGHFLLVGLGRVVMGETQGKYPAWKA